MLFITQLRQRSPVLRRAAPDEVELPSRVTGDTATPNATKHVGYQHNNESSVVLPGLNVVPPARVSRTITRHRPTYSDTKPLASSKRSAMAYTHCRPDSMILNWRAVCGTSPAAGAVVRGTASPA